MTNYYMIKCFIIVWPIIIIIIIKNDISWNLNVVISRGRVEPGFRDDEHIVVTVNNRLLDQVELFARSHWADTKQSDSNVDLSVGFFLQGLGFNSRSDRIAVQKVAEHWLFSPWPRPAVRTAAMFGRESSVEERCFWPQNHPEPHVFRQESIVFCFAVSIPCSWVTSGVGTYERCFFVDQL